MSREASAGRCFGNIKGQSRLKTHRHASVVIVAVRFRFVQTAVDLGLNTVDRDTLVNAVSVLVALVGNTDVVETPQTLGTALALSLALRFCLAALALGFGLASTGAFYVHIALHALSSVQVVVGAHDQAVEVERRPGSTISVASGA